MCWIRRIFGCSTADTLEREADTARIKEARATLENAKMRKERDQSLADAEKLRIEVLALNESINGWQRKHSGQLHRAEDLERQLAAKG